ncbi:ABC transporter substrate-binding protein [Motiliproteus sediminis]|uniref:ABC transporter substrate-binding protein n=1 Tax=Motiliproteus sediminis TaxID=1468178 RepID=UPI001AEF9F6C|nr:ABC transporter substrate-binding protein [Motiliproteus sediminis]
MAPFLRHWLFGLALIVGSTSATLAAKPIKQIAIGYLELQLPATPLLSNVLPEPEDSGLQGARLGIADNNTAGRFLGQHYQLLEARSDDPATLTDAAERWYQQGARVLVANVPTANLVDLSRQFADRDMVIFNSASQADELRTESCLDNVLHTQASRAMLTDALAQWLLAKKLRRWLLIVGTREGDRAYADAIKRSAKRFGGKIVAEKNWTFDADLRRTAQKELPLFTQTDEYDVVVVADEPGDFGEFVLYNTWYPRPVVGTQGLKPVLWHRVVEQWGAAQLQSRFGKQSGRWMTAKDYAAWAAVRSVAEAGRIRNLPADIPLKQRLLHPDFALAGFKGRKLSFRPWNGQLRQPIPLIQPRALIAQSPQEGFLHPITDLDTLGFDRPESRCQLIADH